VVDNGAQFSSNATIMFLARSAAAAKALFGQEKFLIA
jgi:hypothetical protein